LTGFFVYEIIIHVGARLLYCNRKQGISHDQTHCTDLGFARPFDRRRHREASSPGAGDQGSRHQELPGARDLDDQGGLTSSQNYN